MLGVLTANHQLKYRTTDGSTEITTDADWRYAAGWMEGRLVLNEASVEELCLRLRQQFGVTVQVKNKALSGRLLSGTFRKGSMLEEVMETIGEIYQVHYKITDNYVIIMP
jgi:ferric-dicitrate binding protein FerR (iron transport regulator)